MSTAFPSDDAALARRVHPLYRDRRAHSSRGPGLKITPRHLYLAVGAAGGALTLVGFMRGVDPFFLSATVAAVVSLAIYGAAKMRQAEEELREGDDMFRGAFE